MWVPVGRSSRGPSQHGVPRVFLPPGRTWPRGPYLCLRRPSGVEFVGDLHVPVIRGIPHRDSSDRAAPAEVDASGRYALGVHEAISDAGEQVEVLALHRSSWSAIRELLARPFGVRYVVLRVSKAFPIDVERPVVRCHRQAFDLLGCDAGDRVVMVSACVPEPSDAEPSDAGRAAPTTAVWTSVTAQAFEATDADIADRERAEVARPDASHPWLSPSLALGMTIDVPRAYMPAEMRDALGVRDGGVVLMRREIRSLFGRNFREFGLLVLLSGLAISQLPIPIEPGWLTSAVFLPASLALGLVITGGSIRSKVRVGRIERGGRRWRVLTRHLRRRTDG